jgi:magnesium-transporting ATPase (P-type)
VTAAIGDGANDVSMIEEAHVGLGMLKMGHVFEKAFKYFGYLF